MAQITGDRQIPRWPRIPSSKYPVRGCVDDPEELPNASEVINRRLGIAHLRPLAPESWDEDTFYGLIEVFHDLVSRPRMRRNHSYSGCGCHHSELHNGPARTLSRWKINKLLRAADIDY